LWLAYEIWVTVSESVNVVAAVAKTMHLSQPSCRTFLSLRLFWFLMRLLSDRFTVLGQCHSDEYYWGNFTNVISLHNTNTHLSYCDHFCWYIKQLEFYCIAVWCVLVNSQCSSVSTISVSQFSHIFSSILPLPAIKYWYELTSDFSVRAFKTVSAAHLCEQFLQVQQIGFVTLGPLRCA